MTFAKFCIQSSKTSNKRFDTSPESSTTLITPVIANTQFFVDIEDHKNNALMDEDIGMNIKNKTNF